MKFGSLQYLYLVWILPAMVLLAVYSFRKKDQLLGLFSDPHLWGHLMPEIYRRRQVFKFLLLLAGVGLLLMALLRPQWGFHWEEVKRRGVDILVAVDVSESMLAEDIKPNRLERAKREITDFVNMLEGDRIGLIAFAGASFMECPLTLDRSAFKLFLDYLDTDLIPVPGSDVGQAITTAIQSFVKGKRASRALILITDGEDHSKDALRVAEEAKKKGIRIFTVGIGSQEGAPIPMQDGSGGFKKDRSGQVVLTKLDEATLQKIALSTGGSYVRSVTGDLDLIKIYDEIKEKLEAGDLQSTKRRRWEERFQWFLFGSLFLIALESLVPGKKRQQPDTGKPRRRFFVFSRLLMACLCLAALWVKITPAGAESIYAKIHKGEEAYEQGKFDDALKELVDAQVEKPEDVLLKYNIGQTHYRMRNYPEAEEAFLSAAASGDPVLEPKALYNLGNCAYRQGKLEEAVAHYQKTLELDPEDEDARFNLEFVREEIKRRMEEAQKRQEEQQQQQGQSCQNPQQQAGSSKDNQESSQKEGQDARQENQPMSQGAEEAQQQQAGQQPEQAQPEGEEQQAASAARGAEEKDQQDLSEAAASQAAARETGQAMTEEEAERWLNTLSEEQKELARQQIKKALGQSNFRRGKDW